MNVLPDIVRARLNAGQVGAAGIHPDLGALTAFIEGSLPKGPRNEVFVHLAKCARCNELVSLAAPPALENDRPKVKSSWTLWNLVPMPRIAVPVMGTALVLLAVWGTRIPIAEAPVAHVASAPTVIAATPSVAPIASKQAVQRPSEIRTAPQSVIAKASTRSTEVVHADVPEAISRDAANVTMHTTSAPPLPTSTAPTHSPYPTPMTSSVAAPPAGPCWRVSDADTLQKASTCRGGWEDISLGAPVKVRVVLAQANSVWVGGNGGALYYSGDNGEHWSKVNVPMLSDDIVAIVFGTPTHGRLATANGTTWATSDGGQTWRSQ